MHSLKALEFDAVRQALANLCETPMGRSLALALEPTFEKDEVWRRLEATQECYELLGSASPPSLGAVRDARSAFERAEKGGTLGGEELYTLGACLAAMREFRAFLEPLRSRLPRVWRVAETLPKDRSVERALLDALEPDGVVKDSASPELGRIRKAVAATQSRVVERIRAHVSGKSRELLSEPLYTMRDGRYVLPVKSEHKGKIKGIVHDTSASGQTVYVEPADVLELGNRLRELESAEREECERVLQALSNLAGSVAPEARAGIESAGLLDELLARAKLAYQWKGARPQPAEGVGVRLEAARHPLLDPETVVPISIEVGWRTPGVLITGPNTGGKTVAIKCVGLSVLMAQSGLFPPAQAVTLGPFRQVWADIGDEQSIQQSLSTFSGHIKNIAEALRNLRESALVLLDEIGAGTDPAEGAALAKAILTELRAQGAVVLASTHYGELKAFAANTEGFQNAAMEFDAKTLRPTYRLLMGMPGASHALKIAERTGLPAKVVSLARKGLSPEELQVSQLMERMEHAERQARAAQSEADRRASELKRIEFEANRKLQEAAEVRRTVHAQASARIDEALREIRLEAERIFEELKKSGHDPRALQKAREDLKRLQSEGAARASQFETEPEPRGSEAPLVKGMCVRVEGYPQVGVLLSDPKDEQVQVQIGALRIGVATSKVSAAPPPKSPPARRTADSLRRALHARQELHLRMMRAEDALLELDRFLDEAILAGLDRVRIVHGKGTGTLRALTQEALRKSPHVASFREGSPGEGGAGVTIAVLK